MVGLADMSSVSRENIEVMDALIGNFTLYDDVNKVYDIMQGQRKLSLLCEDKEASAKQSIKQLQKQVEVLEKKKGGLMEQNEVEKKRENDKLKRALQEVNVEVNAFEGQIAELEERKEALKRELVNTEESNSSDSRAAVEHEHRLRHELSLFAHISNINWTSADNGAGIDGEGATEIRGVVSKTDKGDLNAFCFDTSKLSKFQIANRLWEAMDE